MRFDPLRDRREKEAGRPVLLFPVWCGAGRQRTLLREMGDRRPPAPADSAVIRTFICVLVTALVLAVPASASDIRVDIRVAPGSLALRAPTNAQAGGKVAVTVVDARGSGAGWKLRIAGRNAVVTAMTVSCSAHSTCTLPRSEITTAVALDTRPTPVLTAPRGTGMGSIRVVATVRGSGRLSFSLVTA
jgi:hypothetical protein